MRGPPCSSVTRPWPPSGTLHWTAGSAAPCCPPGGRPCGATYGRSTKAYQARCRTGPQAGAGTYIPGVGRIHPGGGACPLLPLFPAPGLACYCLCFLPWGCLPYSCLLATACLTHACLLLQVAAVLRDPVKFVRRSQMLVCARPRPLGEPAPDALGVGHSRGGTDAGAPDKSGSSNSIAR